MLFAPTTDAGMDCCPRARPCLARQLAERQKEKAVEVGGSRPPVKVQMHLHLQISNI